MALRRLFLLVYALSGVAGLLYEVAWVRLLTLQMGHTVASTSTVLAAYMGGLAIGSVAGGRYATRPSRRRALTAYAILEIAVAVSALLLPVALSAAHPLLAISYDDGEGGLWFGAVRLVISLFVLAIPTTAMGATFPLAVRSLASDDRLAGRDAGTLYTANTAGAALGAVLAGFVVLPALGLRTTTFLGCALNLTAAATALVIATRQPEVAVVRAEARAPRGDLPARRSAPSAGAMTFARPGLAAAALACSGFAALVNEVAWTRLLALLVGPTSYAFSAMLAVFIAGLACGSVAGTRLRVRQPAAWLAGALLLAGIAAAAVLPLVNGVPVVVARAVADPRAAFTPFVLLESAIAAGLLLPMTFAFGAAFPLAIRAATSSVETAPRAAAGINAANTAGAIAGALLAGFVLIPSVGLQRTLELSSIVVGLAGLAVALAAVEAAKGRLAAAGAFLVVVAAAIALPPFDREVLAGGAYKYAPYLSGVDLTSALKTGTTLFYEEGATGTVSVRRAAGTTTLAIDGKIDASNRGDMLTQKLLAHLPLLLHPAPRDVCIIGLGSGVTLGAAATHPVERIDVVEISPEVVRASAFFRRENHGALADPRTRLIVGDGRSHLLLARRRYDVIISEPSNPWISGMSALFTREFFGAVRARLSDGGLFCQWTHTYDMSRQDLQSIIATFLDVFPAGRPWFAGTGDILLVGGTRPVEPLLRGVTRNWQRPGVAGDLAEVSVRSPFSLLSLQGSNATLMDGRAPVPVQTDDRLALEYSAPRAIYGTTRTATQPIAEALSPGRVTFGTGGVSASAQEWRDRGLMLLGAEAVGPAYESFQRAIEEDPNDAVALDRFVGTARTAGRTGEALTLLERIRARDRGNVAARVQLSRLLAAGGSLEAAEEVAHEALTIDPQDRRAREQLASIYADREDAPRLVPLAAEMMRASPERPDSPYYAGTVQFLSGRFQEAARLAEEATRMDPAHARAWILAGASYGSLGDSDRARRCFEAAVEADPRNPAAYLNLGLLEASAGRPEPAARILAEALLADPGYEPARVALADVLQRIGETDRAAALRRPR